jgi:hypothetical protein
MRPRIIKAQQISQEEIESCKGYTRSYSRKPSVTKSSKMYAYVFGRKVYINKGEEKYYVGFSIHIEEI